MSHCNFINLHLGPTVIFVSRNRVSWIIQWSWPGNFKIFAALRSNISYFSTLLPWKIELLDRVAIRLLSACSHFETINIHSYFIVSLLVVFQNREGCATCKTCLVCRSINVSPVEILSRYRDQETALNCSIQLCVFTIITKAIYNFSILVNSHVCTNFLIAISSWYLQIIAKWFSVIPHENLYNIEDVKDILSCGKCYPECNAVNYNAKISIADLESNQHVAELLWVFIYSLFTVTSTFTNELYWYVRRDNVDIKNQSVLTIYFRKYGTIRLRQDVIYRWYELMGKNILSFRNTRK